jgi:arabinose-5-phosphate isomerase
MSPRSASSISDDSASGAPPASGSEASFIAEILRGEAAAMGNLAQAVEQDPVESKHWQEAIDMIAACTGHVVLSGMGKSGLIGAKISATLSSVGIPSHVLHPADAVHGDLGAIRQEDVVLLLSYSGRTEEIVNLATILRADGVKRLAITTSHDSDLARLCDAHLALGPLEEVCPLSLAPTTSTTLTLACGDALALSVARRRAFKESDFHQRHPGGSLGDGLRPVRELLRFRAGKNLTVLPDTISVGQALEQAWPDDSNSAIRQAGAIILSDSDGRLSGIFTDGDLRRLVLKQDRPLDTPIREVMTSNPRHLRQDDRLNDARQMVAEFRIDEIPVVDADGQPVGLIDIQDLMTLRVTGDSMS